MFRGDLRLSTRSRLASIRRERWLQVILLGIAYLGARLAEAGSIVGLLLAVVCLTLTGLVEFYSRRKIPHEARGLVIESKKRWGTEFFIHTNVAIFVLGLGFLVELLFISISLLHALIAIGYVVATLVVYYLLRRRIVSESWTVLLGFTVSALSMPFSLVAYKNPELLADTFSYFGISVQVSQDLSEDLIIGLQFALVLYSSLSLSHAWRSHLLTRNGLGVKELEDRFQLALERSSSQPWIADFSEGFSDIPRLLSLFQEGSFPTVLSLGWSMIERGLSLVSQKPTVRRGHGRSRGVCTVWRS
jgi:hypothetical protein